MPNDIPSVLASPLLIGSHTLPNPVVLAPMAGVTDLPFRELCMELGAGMAVGEMLTSDPSLANSRKTILRKQSSPREGIRSVQIVGSEPTQLAEAARLNADDGADIIDINMGCPAKKVCKKAAGSALLADEALVGRILTAVVAAVDVPVTLKIRTGTNPNHRNGAQIARIAEDAGIQMLAVHGRTRADRFNGDAEYDTIAEIVGSVAIPVLANGDITSADKAREVLARTGAAGVMVGRAAQGQPWLPGIIACSLAGAPVITPTPREQVTLMLQHLDALHDFYGEFMGIRIARKHMGWFFDASFGADQGARRWKAAFNKVESAAEQRDLLIESLDTLSQPVASAGRQGSNAPHKPLAA